MRSVALVGIVVAAAFVAARAVGADPPPAPPVAVVEFGEEPQPLVVLERDQLVNPVAPSESVHWIRPASGKETLPVVVFLHGFGAQGPEPYLAWLEHLARRGALVVFPTYPAFEARTEHTKYDVMWAGFEAGLAAAAARPGVRADPARLTVVGHSFGGGAANAIAARAQARGYGAAALAIAPFAPWYDLDRGAWDAIPAHAHLLVTIYADDRICDPLIGVSFLASAATIRKEQKGLRVYHSDDRERPRLSADHLAPTSRRIDALDRAGAWRALDALIASASGDPRGGAVAFGTDAAALSLGTWTDGTPMRPASTTWTASADAPACAWTCHGKQETWMRKLLEPESWSTLPLPSPAKADLAKLPSSERFWMRPGPEVVGAAWTEPMLHEASGGFATVGREGTERLKAAGIGLFQTNPTPFKQGTAVLHDTKGVPLLWRRADDPHLVDAAIALAGKKPTTGATSPK